MCTRVVTCREDDAVADRYCGNCGHELSPDDQFCRNCGRPVHQAARVPTPEADVPVPPQPQAGVTEVAMQRLRKHHPRRAEEDGACCGDGSASSEYLTSWLYSVLA